jgi:hypothetical protein
LAAIIDEEHTALFVQRDKNSGSHRRNRKGSKEAGKNGKRREKFVHECP